MKTIDVMTMSDYEHLGTVMYELAEDGLVVCSVLSSEQAFELLRELSIYDDVQLGSIHLQNGDYECYDREYYVTLDTDMVLDIEPAWHNGDDKHSAGYAYNEADVFFFDTNASAAVMLPYQNKTCYELRFGDVDYDEDDICEDCSEDCSDCDIDNDDAVLAYLHNLKAILDELFE